MKHFVVLHEPPIASEVSVFIFIMELLSWKFYYVGYSSFSRFLGGICKKNLYIFGANFSGTVNVERHSPVLPLICVTFMKYLMKFFLMFGTTEFCLLLLPSGSMASLCFFYCYCFITSFNWRVWINLAGTSHLTGRVCLLIYDVRKVCSL